MANINDVVSADIPKERFNKCIDDAQNVLQHLTDRVDLHSRDNLERFINILMGEVAESLVEEWLQRNGKYARSAVDKTSGIPDLGHDLILKNSDGIQVKCSIKSSLSYKLDLGGVLSQCKLATKHSELRDVNIQVYFLLSLNPPEGQARVTVPCIRQAYIVGWFGKNDINSFTSYKHEQREAPTIPLSQARPMSSLLHHLT